MVLSLIAAFDILFRQYGETTIGAIWSYEVVKATRLGVNRELGQ